MLTDGRTDWPTETTKLRVDYRSERAYQRTKAISILHYLGCDTLSSMEKNNFLRTSSPIMALEFVTGSSFTQTVQCLTLCQFKKLPTVRGSSPGRGKGTLLFFKTSRPVLGPNQLPIQFIAGVLSWG